MAGVAHKLTVWVSSDASASVKAFGCPADRDGVGTYWGRRRKAFRERTREKWLPVRPRVLWGIVGSAGGVGQDL